MLDHRNLRAAPASGNHGALLFGSRAKGTASTRSDIDLALEGINDPLRAESVAGELDELPLPYQFDITVLPMLRHGALRQHIARVVVHLARESDISK